MRFRPAILSTMVIWALVSGCATGDSWQIVSAPDGRVLTTADMTERFRGHRLILVGEHHDNPAHHAAQLAVIRHLDATGVPVAVGMEMFRQESQPDLDRWVGGVLSREAFQAIFKDNWNYGWDMYAPILDFAKERSIPVVGLNVPKGITRKVARSGFKSLEPEQKGQLPDITCDVTDRYRKFIRGAHGAHGHGQMNFEHFCEAQLVWDMAMAAYALDYIKANPRRVMVIIAGAGHAQKSGIPTRVRQRSDEVPLVLLPEDPFAGESAIAGEVDFWVRAP